MTTSASTFPQRLTQIDDLIRPDHYWLADDDDCYFLGEYTARKGFAFSATNQLIHNFKKGVDRRGTLEWRHKEAAVREAAGAFCSSINATWLDDATLVPLPPSRAKADPLYDDRMVRMLQSIRMQPALDVRELIVQQQSMVAAHGTNQRPRPDEIEANYSIDQALCNPTPRTLGVFDDVLTTGAHYRAAHGILRRTFPEARIVGVFIARRVPEAIDWDPPM